MSDNIDFFIVLFGGEKNLRYFLRNLKVVALISNILRATNTSSLMYGIPAVETFLTSFILLKKK